MNGMREDALTKKFLRGKDTSFETRSPSFFFFEFPKEFYFIGNINQHFTWNDFSLNKDQHDRSRKVRCTRWNSKRERVPWNFYAPANETSSELIVSLLLAVIRTLHFHRNAGTR